MLQITSFFNENIFDTCGNPWQLRDSWMDSGAVFSFTVDVVPGFLKRILEYAGLDENDVNWLILHQANKQIVETIAAKAGFSTDKAPAESFGRYGNLASASIPVAMCDAFCGMPFPGRTLLCGYGIGLSWGGCLCDLQNLNCAGTLDFMPDPHRPTRSERIERWIKIRVMTTNSSRNG